jgi:hypothetical protein
MIDSSLSRHDNVITLKPCRDAFVVVCVVGVFKLREFWLNRLNLLALRMKLKKGE